MSLNEMKSLMCDHVKSLRFLNTQCPYLLNKQSLTKITVVLVQNNQLYQVKYANLEKKKKLKYIKV